MFSIYNSDIYICLHKIASAVKTLESKVELWFIIMSGLVMWITLCNISNTSSSSEDCDNVVYIRVAVTAAF